MKDIYFIIPLIVSALVIISLTTVSESTDTNSNRCQPDSLDAIDVKFPVKTPTYLPEGYKLVAVDDKSWDTLNPGRIIVMNYDIEDLCNAKLFGMLGSTIAIAAIDMTHLDEIRRYVYTTNAVESINMYRAYEERAINIIHLSNH